MMNSTVKKLACLLLFAASLGGSATVAAQARFFDGGFGMQQGRDRGEPRRGGNDDRRAGPDRGQGDERFQQRRNNDRMSPDERRALRQQIDEAGRDIYRRR
ncbi:hypothetical protein [uncultured Oxalicibacterium sp.]|uniref:hypothetical protein n=1 Tax=uncultured Oxalicibacterium sp. TaxID=1168540 RepID=UPI0025CD2567|nr:hypothetical protein [uncultured Oxalicibacterium sp.]